VHRAADEQLMPSTYVKSAGQECRALEMSDLNPLPVREQLADLLARGMQYFAAITPLVPERQANSARDHFASLPREFQDIALGIGREYAGLARSASAAVQRSRLLTDADARHLGRAVKGVRAALRLRRYQFWDAQEIADQDRLLDVRPADESEEWLVPPGDAAALYASWSDEIARRLELVDLDHADVGRHVPEHKMSPSSIRLFISHSSEDQELAAGVVELLRISLNLLSAAIRCTSVDGYRLPGGADTNQQLRAEVHDANAFIGIVSQGSVRSLYVLFELGARWGAGRHLLPLLAPATPASALGGPLGGLNALRADSRAQLHQLVSDVARVLGITPEDGASYQVHIDRVMALAERATTEVSADSGLGGDSAERLVRRTASVRTLNLEERGAAVGLSTEGRELLIEATRDQSGAIMVAEAMGGVSISANGKEFVALGQARSEARWRRALRELVGQGLVENRGDGSLLFVTDEGFRAVELWDHSTAG
jgi:hypothetical protein